MCFPGFPARESALGEEEHSPGDIRQCGEICGEQGHAGVRPATPTLELEHTEALKSLSLAAASASVAAANDGRRRRRHLQSWRNRRKWSNTGRKRSGPQRILLRPRKHSHDLSPTPHLLRFSAPLVVADAILVSIFSPHGCPAPSPPARAPRSAFISAGLR